MVSTAEQGPPSSRRAVRDAVAWGRVVVGTSARGVVATLLGLALWAAAPAVIGWHPTTVMTGSMEPRLRPGDVVVSRPVPATDLRIGQVLLADDPDQPGHLRMHRAVATGPEDTVVTKGDANPGRDSTPVEPSAVHGVASLRIPVVAAPIVWMRDGAWAKVALAALAFGVVLWLCTVDGALRRSGSAPEDDEDEDGEGGPRHAADTGREAPRAAGTSARVEGRSGRHVLLRQDVSSRRAVRRPGRDGRRRGRGAVAAVALLVTGGVGVLVPAQAVAGPFTRTTVNPASTFAATTPVAVTGLTCTNNADKSVTIGYTYSGVAANSFDALAGSTVVGSSPGTQRSIVVKGQSILSLGTPVNVAVRTDLGGSWTATSQTIAIKTALLSTDLSC
ncbi:S26 family signal peptidase [Curtobacterium sp. MCBA15_001]|uniref:S26 family signal peptidase n=1 Tax=Curtobacterium sp. MCBA15_001 TaxID=1898731 RepID=UPI0008DD5737|nr:S26 family signal peptidase [Curtobacterium sp. MCBA15_001]OIH97662.1 hypothetical protein BIU90_13900 [Curtobacterium sp. MCBA15_001]